VRQAQRKGREQGGVRIYLDGFRVFPYGDPAEDWLRLNDVRAGRNQRLVTPTGILRKEEESISGRPWLLTPGNNQVFGAVYISQLQHPEIIPNVSRERLVENEAFNQLRYFVQLGVYWMTIQYARVTVGVREARRTPVRTGVPEIIQKAEIKVSEVAELPAEPKQQILRVLEHARQTAVEEVEDHISEISMLRVLSSTGTTVSMVNHQLRAVLDGMRMIYIDLLELKPFVYAEHIGNFEKIIQRIQNWRETVKQQVSQLGFLLGLEARTQRRRLAIRELVDNVVTPLSRYMSDYGIEFENNVPANLKSPPVFEAELYSVLLHVFTNALKAVRERQLSRIAIKASEVEGGIRIWVLDTGVGIPIDKREEVFKPFVTTSAPDPILNVGTGLGLKIVRDTLTTYEGTAQFIDTVEPWKTCLEIFIPG
jgi:signal transduction histidine kinase